MLAYIMIGFLVWKCERMPDMRADNLKLLPNPDCLFLVFGYAFLLWNFCNQRRMLQYKFCQSDLILLALHAPYAQEFCLLLRLRGYAPVAFHCWDIPCATLAQTNSANCFDLMCQSSLCQY